MRPQDQQYRARIEHQAPGTSRTSPEPPGQRAARATTSSADSWRTGHIPTPCARPAPRGSRNRASIDRASPATGNGVAAAPGTWCARPEAGRPTRPATTVQPTAHRAAPQARTPDPDPGQGIGLERYRSPNTASPITLRTRVRHHHLDARALSLSRGACTIAIRARVHHHCPQVQTPSLSGHAERAAGSTLPTRTHHPW